MKRVRELLLSSENLTWAWKKARWLYAHADGPVDVGAVSAFELDLERNLKGIARDFDKLTYKLKPLLLAPQPKSPDADGNPRRRQSFDIAVRDQVAWIALTNVIGPLVDSKMPPWSYGHRLYKAAWYETQADGRLQLEIGPYRHSSGMLFRKFKHSWPLFRRHISLTARMMANGLRDEEQLDIGEQNALRYSERPKYLNRNGWKKDRQTLYYASIDLERFYPSIKAAAIVRSLQVNLEGFREDEWLATLVGQLLKFRVSRAGSEGFDDETLEPATKAGSFPHIPTGLMVAGFLSNVAMLPVDKLVERLLKDKYELAHFRFVDDHAFIAYDFDDIRKWIALYERVLAKYDVGPIISAKKFDPPLMAEAYQPDADQKIVEEVKKQAEINGANPSTLMTKTLALVSELAGTDFDILSEDSREQRLRELEWLLMAELPATEIRPDTRASFAAARIATLAPLAFQPSIELLRTWRDAAANAPAPGMASSSTFIALSKTAADLEGRDHAKYDSRLAHYFRMIFQAFCDHPDKPRLFIRLLDFARITGHDGTSDVLRWMKENHGGKHAGLAAYFRPLALQTIASHIATASAQAIDNKLLHRQRRAAFRYLQSVASEGSRELLGHAFEASGANVGALNRARSTIMAAVALAREVSAKDLSFSSLRTDIEKLAADVGAPALSGSSEAWQATTTFPIGVWSHWLQTVCKQRGAPTSWVWRLTVNGHDARNRLDWINLRKEPHYLPPVLAAALLGEASFPLQPDDAGWLLETVSIQNEQASVAMMPPSRVAKTLGKFFRQRRAFPNSVSALEWVWHLREVVSKDPYDPRASEWTALEVLRLLLVPLTQFPPVEDDLLDRLHPVSVLIPRDWTKAEPGASAFHVRWTWESWRFQVRNEDSSVTTLARAVADYRRQPATVIDKYDFRHLWIGRLRACGLLLLGLCARDFSLPAIWNVRGMERDAGQFLRSTSEELAISSGTMSILEAALLPRSAETAIIRQMPKMFFGIQSAETINDTETDAPLIEGVGDLIAAIERAQKTLEELQISVLNHGSRQMIPMSVLQLRRAAVAVSEEGGQDDN